MLESLLLLSACASLQLQLLDLVLQRICVLMFQAACEVVLNRLLRSCAWSHVHLVVPAAFLCSYYYLSLRIMGCRDLRVSRLHARVTMCVPRHGVRFESLSVVGWGLFLLTDCLGLCIQIIILVDLRLVRCGSPVLHFNRSRAVQNALRRD